MNKLGFLIFLSFVMSVANASELAPRTKEYRHCIEKAGAIDPAVLECVGDENTRQDKRLNIAYRKLMASLKGDRKKQLLETQRLWMKYTEANCSFYYDPDGGTLARMMSAECDVTAKILRAAELEELAKF